MTKEQINIAVAEADGDEQALALLNNNNHPNLWSAVEQYLRNMGKLYTESYDAILPVIQKQPVSLLFKMVEIRMQTPPDRLFIESPEQLCIALSKALGKWKE